MQPSFGRYDGSAALPIKGTRLLILDEAQNGELAGQDRGSDAHEPNDEEKTGEGNGHDEKRQQKRDVNRRRTQPKDARRLVQRVPPIDRELDDRQVDGADQS